MNIRFSQAGRCARQEVGGRTVARIRCRFRGTKPSESRQGSRVRNRVIVVNLELGCGNVLSIRGKGGGLSWDRGQAMIQTDAKTWLWSSLITNEKIEFQLLLNDEVWARGDTHVLEPGASIELTPDFEWPDIPRTSSIPAKSGSQTCIGRAQPTRGRRFARGPFRSATR